MAWLSSTVAALGVFGSLIWLVHLIHLGRHRRDVVELADVPDREPEGGWPSLAVIVAARDEAGSIEAAIRSLLVQDYPGLRVIAVDDRSADATGPILDALAAESDRLTVVHVRDLPDGWLGKTNALQMGADATDARWILFTDADVVFAPGALRKSIAYAESERADHVCAIPEVLSDTSAERVFLAMFGLLFSMHARPGKIADFSSRANAGVGAFNLIRAESFRAIGGFRHLALSVDDDIRLARALKYGGYAARLVLGRRAVAVRWQVGLGGMIRGLEKNFFAGMFYSLPRALGAGAAVVILGIAPHAGLFVGPIWTRAVCGIGVASIVLALAGTKRGSGIGGVYGLILPVGAVAVLVALVRSVVLTLARGGVIWRGHLYPLAALRAHVRLREAWTREVWRSTR
ncbi:glycosyltransferase [Tundrisphaera sp. TA3]|uniref:glycosyltransferase n=1 Tax=Tundrisphaera sp. TA3 TaxID=3435775 RepID=UPI003EC04AAE